MRGRKRGKGRKEREKKQERKSEHAIGEERGRACEKRRGPLCSRAAITVLLPFSSLVDIVNSSLFTAEVQPPDENPMVGQGNRIK